MNKQTRIAIAALLMISMALAVSTSAVNATHVPTVEITPTLTTTGDIDFEIDVTNTGGSPITNVDVKLPFDVIGEWVGTLMADTVAAETALADGTVLSAGTGIPITTDFSLTLAENTPITLGKTDINLKTLLNGTAEWTTDEKYSGDYSVKLTVPADQNWLHEGRVQVFYGQALSTISDDGSDLKFWYNTTATTTGGILHGRLWIDSDGGNVVDKILISDSTPEQDTDGKWHETTFAPLTGDHWREANYDPTTDIITDYPPDGWRGTIGEYKSLHPDATLVYASPAWCGGSVSHDEAVVYIDDVMIAGKTCWADTPGVTPKISIGEGVVVIVPAGTKFTGTPGSIPLGTVVTLLYDTYAALPEGAYLVKPDVELPAMGLLGDPVLPVNPSEVKLSAGTKIQLTVEVPSSLTGYDGTLPSDTHLVLTDDVEDAMLYEDTEGEIGLDVTEAKLISETACPLIADNKVKFPTTTNEIKVLEGTKVVLTISDEDMPIGSELELAEKTTLTTLWGASTVVLVDNVLGVEISDTAKFTLPNSEVTATLSSPEDVTLPEGTEIVLPAKSEVTLGATAGTSVGGPVSLSVTIKSDVNDKIKLTVDGGDPVTYTIAGSAEGIEYSTGDALVDAINDAISESGATASWVDDHIVFTSNTVGPDSSVDVDPESLAASVLGFLTQTKTSGTGMVTSMTLPIPDDWKVTEAADKTAIWENATADGAIEPGESQTFSIRVNIDPDIVDGGEYLWTIKTTAADGSVAYRTLTTTVDGIAPEIASENITMEPDMVGAGPATIKVVASEELSKLENVYYQIDDNEDHIGDPANLIAMESADGITWTGTLMVPKDGLWDGSKVDIEILAAGYEDPAGNEGSAVSKTIHSIDAPHINTLAPVLPEDLEMTETTPFDNEVNQKSQLITGIAKDNLAGTPIAKEGLTVKISVNDTVYETKSFASGLFTKEINLDEGPNTIKVWVVDELGNAGPENVQAVFLDTIKPTISMDSVAGKAYEDNVPVNDNTPAIVLTIKDPGYPATALGIEYENITVTLENADGDKIDTLDNATPWDKATGRFENTIPLAIIDSAGLPDGFYRILVDATDAVTNNNSATFWFEVDTIAPPMPKLLTAANNPVLDDTSVTEPKVQKETKLVLYGSGLEPSCEVEVYLVDQATGSVISTETTTADTAGGFSKSLTLVGGKTIRIEVETSDAAGNVSSRLIYGYAMADATAPVVTLEALPEMTDETSIILSGTVDKDAWEDWSDITLMVQVGIGSVEVQIGAEGDYSCSVPLSMGVNTIAARATDSVGNISISATATVERVFTMDTTAPSVTLDALPEATDKASITISGTVSKDTWEDWSDITLTVQVGTGRVEVPIGAGGSYDYSIGLAEGSNTIAVQATDGVGNTGTAAYATVERTVTPWGIYAIILVIIALLMAAIAIFRKKR